MFLLRFILLLAELTPSSPFLCCATHPRVWPCCSRQYCNFAKVETCGSWRAPHSFFITAFLLTQDQQGEVSVMSLTRFKDWAAAWTASIASHHAWTKSSLLPRDWQWSGDFSPRKFFPSHHHPGETKNLLAFSANCFPTGTDMLGRSRFRLVWSRSAGLCVVCSLPSLGRTDVFARRILCSFKTKTDTNVCTIE